MSEVLRTTAFEIAFSRTVSGRVAFLPFALMFVSDMVLSVRCIWRGSANESPRRSGTHSIPFLVFNETSS